MSSGTKVEMGMLFLGVEKLSPQESIPGARGGFAELLQSEFLFIE